jgi:thioredoxin 1
VDEAADIAQEYGVSAMPTFLVWKNGKVQEKVMGANAPALVQSIRKFL